MVSKPIIIILLASVAIAYDVGAEDYPIRSYLDLSRFPEDSTATGKLLWLVLEAKGSDDPALTKQYLERFFEAMKESLPQELVDYHLDMNEQHYLKELVSLLLKLTRIGSGGNHHLPLGYLMNVICQHIKCDIDILSAEKPSSYGKMYSFMIYYIKKALPNSLDYAVQSDLELSEGEKQMDIMVSGNPNYESGSDEKRILELAKGLDLVKGNYKPRKMIDTLEHYYEEDFSTDSEKAHRRLLRIMVKNCGDIVLDFSYRMELFNLNRLMLPGISIKPQPSIRFLKLNEYMRICQPVVRDDKADALYENIRRQMPTLGKRIKNLIG